ncbi:MAG TPA: outer membrane beta-barrel protein [Xanthobacteraceae bacterium]
MKYHMLASVMLGSAALLALLVAGPASAADMAVKAPILKAPPKPIYNWTGFYIGGNVGYSWGRGDTDFSDSSTSVSNEFRGVPPLTLVLGTTVTTTTAGAVSGSADINGIVGGGQVGYNAQYNNWVVGLEADIQGTGQRGSLTLLDPVNNVLATVNDKMPWFATFRARVGLTPAPTWLLYVTGGGAVAGIDQDLAVGPPGGPMTVLSANTTRLGWVVGGGAEAAIENTNWTVKGEFLHMDFGSVGSAAPGTSTTTTVPNAPILGFSTVTVTTTSGAFNTRVTDNVVRVGLNYRLTSK